MYERKDIKNIIAEILAEKASIGGVKSLYYAGCGGSWGALYPAKKFMENECANIKCCHVYSNEFVHDTPKDFGPNSILVVACHKGNTPETIAACRLGKEKGAAVIILTWLEESEIIQYGDYIIQYAFDASPDHLAGGIDYSSEKVMCALAIAVELLNQTAGYENYDKMYDGFSKIAGIVSSARALVKPRAVEFAKKYFEEKNFYTMGAGAGYSAAYMECICIFQEMQWLDSSSIHSGEFFHGPFELTDPVRVFLIQLSVGKNRELDERALRFLRKHAEKIEVFDAEEYGLGAIDNEVADYFNHTLFSNVYAIYNHELAELRNHPLTTRRYMWKEPY